MGYNFDMSGTFKFDKKLPDNIVEMFKKMNDNNELGKAWYQDAFKNQRITAEWCPWIFDETYNELNAIRDSYAFNHNYYFIDWLSWIIESICLPNGIKLNGYGGWTDDSNWDYEGSGLPRGNGEITITDNYIKTRGTFYGSDDYKQTIKYTNNIVNPNAAVEERAKRKAKNSPAGEVKGSFCVTGKVSMSRSAFKAFGIANGYHDTSSSFNSYSINPRNIFTFPYGWGYFYRK